MPKKLSKDEFKKIYSKVPRLSVDLVIKTPEGVVLTKRSIEPYKGKWHLPGGTVLMDEGIEEAVKRLAKEETGLDVEITKFIEVVEYEEMKEKGGVGYAVALVYLVYVVGGTVKKDNNASEIKIFKEIPKDSIKKHKAVLEKLM